MNGTIEVRGTQFKYETYYDSSTLSEYSDVTPVTDFYTELRCVETVRRRYWLFGPKLITWSSEPVVLFSVNFHIDTDRLTTEEVRTRVERAHDLWKRKADLAAGKLI